MLVDIIYFFLLCQDNANVGHLSSDNKLHHPPHQGLISIWQVASKRNIGRFPILELYSWQYSCRVGNIELYNWYLTLCDSIHSDSINSTMRDLKQRLIIFNGWPSDCFFFILNSDHILRFLLKNTKFKVLNVVCLFSRMADDSSTTVQWMYEYILVVIYRFSNISYRNSASWFLILHYVRENISFELLFLFI